MVCRKGGNEGEVINGRRDFQWRRLNVLQIGLGTFGTVVENVADPGEAHPGLNWLLGAASDSSANMLSVSVEPVPEHAGRLQPLLRRLPNSALVLAAIVRRGKKATMHAVTPERYQKCLREVAAADWQAFNDLVLYLRNMSCVGQAHPEFEEHSAWLEKHFGVKVEAEPIEVAAFTYDALALALRFRGVEVLIIDAEGHDCQILQSMIDHCSQDGGRDAWPDVIQFETMGHNDKVNGSDTEFDLLQALEGYGYYIVCYGLDTQLVRASALQEKPHLQRWVDASCCQRCSHHGLSGMPFHHSSREGTMCTWCYDTFLYLGASIFDWERLPGGPEVATSVATDGSSLCVVDSDGSAFHLVKGNWECIGRGLADVAVVTKSRECFALDRKGRLVRRDAWTQTPWTPLQLPRGSRSILKHVAAQSDGYALWATDEDSCIHIYLTAEQRWYEASGKLEQLSVSADGSHVWGVNSYGEVYYRPGFRGPWEYIPGKLCQVAVSADGCHVWGVNDSDEVFYRAGVHGKWGGIPGQLRQICASESSSKLWGICPDGVVWECNTWA